MLKQGKRKFLLNNHETCSIIIFITISLNVIGALTANFLLIVLYSCNRTVGRNRTPVIEQLK